MRSPACANLLSAFCSLSGSERTMGDATILLLTPDDDLARGVGDGYGTTFLAFWASPELAGCISRRTLARQISDEIAPPFPQMIEDQYAAARAILSRIGDECAQAVFLAKTETYLAHCLMTRLAALNAFRALESRFGSGATVSMFTGGVFGSVFAQINDHLGRPFRISPRPGSGRRASRSRALERLVRESVASRDPASLVWTPLEVLDQTFGLRSHLWRPARSDEKVAFFSSYSVLSQNLALHAARTPVRPHWLVNGRSGAKGVPPSDPHSYLWQWGRARRRPADLAHLARAVVSGIHGAPEVGGVPMRVLAWGKPTLEEELISILPGLLAQSDLMEDFLDLARPKEIWVANQWSVEGMLLDLARARGIRTVQVQHGMLEEYYAFSPVYSDRFLLWGEFWKELASPAEQHRIEVVDPGVEVAEASRTSQNRTRRHVAFFTAPPTLVPLWNPAALLWESATLIERLIDAGMTVTVRVHPMDRINTWRSACRRVAGSFPDALRFEKGGPLVPLLERTDVAIAFGSTVFLNCLASGIPAISLGWYPLMWRRQLEQGGFIHFADSIEESVRLAKDLDRGSYTAPDLSPLLAGRSA